MTIPLLKDERIRINKRFYTLFQQAVKAEYKLKNMKLNAGIITDKIKETKEFYTRTLKVGISFENEFYLLLHTPDNSSEISFLHLGHPDQKPIFQQPLNGKGIYLTIEVQHVDDLYKSLKEKGIHIEIELRNEPWGDRHFAIVGPNGIGIDIVTYTKPEEVK